ncbi:type-F conjugative transfer system pilin assembly protein TrbC [Parvularcula oceani]|uniref:type-F conjugative transfer system pilin assembly protein TrbC n=1 Tax=Parvularcula oceani TaxID=1247963 RepID=UPI00068FD770|nr:type-F conjugative transfer system pilin assembly protein TrbC [Parvularcula oceani]
MSSDPRSLVLALVVIFALAPYAQAQDKSQIGRERIEQAVRNAEDEAATFASEVAKRAEAYADDALALSEAVTERMEDVETGARAEGPIDVHAMLAGAPTIAEAARAEPPAAGVIVFASFAMPENSLRALVRDAHAAGVPVFLRGFKDGSLGATAKAMRSLLGPDGTVQASATAGQPLGGVAIDPRAFRVFGVAHVPVFVATDHALPDCDGLDCSAPPPPHARIAGNMSLTAALEALAEEGTVGRDTARAALARLGDRP